MPPRCGHCWRAVRVCCRKTCRPCYPASRATVCIRAADAKRPRPRSSPANCSKPCRSLKAMFAKTRARFQRRIREWAKSRQGPDGRRVTVAQRRLYILPTPQGFLFGLTLFVMLLGSLNYANSMGFMLTFLLFSLVVISMNAAHANLLGLELVAASAEPVFAGETARFHLAVHNPSRRTRIAVTLSAE